MNADLMPDVFSPKKQSMAASALTMKAGATEFACLAAAQQDTRAPLIKIPTQDTTNQH
jgi:hypothetical protein